MPHPPPSFLKRTSPPVSAFSTTRLSASLQTDAANRFGLGVSNQYARIDDGSTTASGLLEAFNEVPSFNGGIFSANFLFIEPSNIFLGTTTRNDDISVRLGDNPDSNTVAVDVRLNNGTLTASGFTGASGSYLLDTVYAMDIVGNESGSALTDYRGSQDLPNNAYDVYLTDTLGNTVLALDDVAFRNNGQNIRSFIFQSFGNARQTLDVDNIVLTDDEAVVLGVTSIPEPTSAAAIGLLAMVGLRRRRA